LPSSFEFLNKVNDIERDLIQEFRDLGLGNNNGENIEGKNNH
jgi:hypothetical protein